MGVGDCLPEKSCTLYKLINEELEHALSQLGRDITDSKRNYLRIDSHRSMNFKIFTCPPLSKLSNAVPYLGQLSFSV
jgi:hypothetical protein